MKINTHRLKQSLQQTMLILSAFLFLGYDVAFAATPLTQEDVDTLLRTSVWYNDEPIASSGCALVNLTGSDNAEKVYNFLTGKGLQPFQAAGVMGNMHVESVGIEPQRQQGLLDEKIPAENFPDPRGASGWGIVQWTPGSKFISTQTPISQANDLGVQLNFLWEQLEGRGPLPEKRAGDELKATENVNEATYAFMGNMLGNPSPAGKRYFGFERPSAENQVVSIAERLTLANGYLAKYGSGQAGGGGESGSVTGACGQGGSGEVVGELALIVDRKWYDQFPERFARRHHDSTPSVDIALPQGTPVYSMTGGTVHRAPMGPARGGNGWGMGVEIKTDDNVYIKYAHGIDGGAIVKPGDRVEPGQLIMHVGSTGQSTGPHIHLQISLGSQGGTNVCPQPLLKALYEGQPVTAFASLPRSGCTS